MKKLTWAVLIATLVALGFGIRKARAQTYEMQPFTAVQTTVHRSSESTIPKVETGIVAVSGDGQLIAQLRQSPLTTAKNVMTRWIINRKEQKSIVIDPAAKMRVTHPYHYHGLIADNKFSGGHCDGALDGQIEGFDVTLSESHVADVPSGEKETWKAWAAPKLGCFILREQRSTADKDGKFVQLTVVTLTNIVIGEPDPSYFDTSLPEGFVEAKPEDYKGAIVNHNKAQQQKQPQ
jgi:hypothetical protein